MICNVDIELIKICLLENNYGSPFTSLKHIDVRLYLSQAVKNDFYQPSILQGLCQIQIILQSANVDIRIFATQMYVQRNTVLKLTLVLIRLGNRE